MKPLSFYHEIEEKVCSNCGESFKEQCESYIDVCEMCLRDQEE